jgi:uncharacterized protein (TIGR03067 family)
MDLMAHTAWVRNHRWGLEVADCALALIPFFLFTPGPGVIGGSVGLRGSPTLMVSAVKADGINLNGSWAALRVEKDGKPISMPNLVLDFEDKMVVGSQRQNQLFTWAFNYNKDTKPVLLDVVDTSGPNKGKKRKGLLDIITQKNIRIILADYDKERPTDFVTRPNSGSILYTLKKFDD